MEKPFIIVARRAGMAYQNISRIVLVPNVISNVISDAEDDTLVV